MARETGSGRGRRRGTGRSVGRALGLLAVLPAASRAPLYGRLLWDLVRDERTPWSRKALLGGAAGYLLLGRDLIPDDVPVLGSLDDLVVVALAVDLFLDGVDDAVLGERLEALGIDRAAFDVDVARVRRLLPGPIRRAARRLPDALRLAGQALQQSGVGPRLRAWITMEDSIA